MSAPASQNAAFVDAQLETEANKALVRGSLYAALLGLTSGGIVFAILALGFASDLQLPAWFALLCGAYACAVWALARTGRIRGWVTWAALAPFTSMPTLFFVGTHILMPAGAATYITGPISYLYFVLIVVTGFLFRPRLTVATGLWSAAGYLLVYFLAREQLATIRAPDPVLHQDLVSFPIYFVKAFMMAAGGVFVAGLAVIARRLILRTLDEMQDRERVSRLFGQYVSEEVKDRILRDGAGVGERKEVAILFSDLRGFSTWSERTEPEQIVARLNEYFDAMVECITAEGGVVDKFIGDAIMAVFGGVLPHPAPCDAAVRAARRMRERLASLNARWQERGLEPLENGIGLHFGPVLQGAIGSAQRKDFTVIGDAVNIASRIEGLTKSYPQPILITDELYQRLGEEARRHCVAQGRSKVKGRTEEVALWGVPDAVAPAESVAG